MATAMDYFNEYVDMDSDSDGGEQEEDERRAQSMSMVHPHASTSSLSHGGVLRRPSPFSTLALIQTNQPDFGDSRSGRDGRSQSPRSRPENPLLRLLLEREEEEEMQFSESRDRGFGGADDEEYDPDDEGRFYIGEDDDGDAMGDESTRQSDGGSSPRLTGTRKRRLSTESRCSVDSTVSMANSQSSDHTHSGISRFGSSSPLLPDWPHHDAHFYRPTLNNTTNASTNSGNSNSNSANGNSNGNSNGSANGNNSSGGTFPFVIQPVTVTPPAFMLGGQIVGTLQQLGLADSSSGSGSGSGSGSSSGSEGAGSRASSGRGGAHRGILAGGTGISNSSVSGSDGDSGGFGGQSFSVKLGQKKRRSVV